MTLDLPQCQEQPRGEGRKKNVSLREEAGKNEVLAGVVLDIREGQCRAPLRLTFFLGGGEEGFKSQPGNHGDTNTTLVSCLPSVC